MNEQRSFIRHPSDIPLEVHRGRTAGSTRHLYNVSLGGLSFDSDACLEQGMIVRIRIPIVSPAFETSGEVAWCKRRNGGYEVGVRFTEAEDAFKTRMVEQVCHIEQYKREVREQEGRVLSGDEAAREWIHKFAADFPGAAPRRS